MPIKTRKELPMPEELYIKLTKVIYQLYQWGVPVNGAIEIGRVIVENYWRERNAKESGQSGNAL